MPLPRGGTAARRARANGTSISLSVYDDLSSIEAEWRAFEQVADGTVFQSFEWLSTWQRHVGEPRSVIPAIVAGRDADGQLLFIFALAVEKRGFVRQLTWLGADLGDYNGPLLAPRFADCIDGDRFIVLWREVMHRLQDHSKLGFDVVHLDKMQGNIGSQRNPFVSLWTRQHPTGAYRTELTKDWDSFYKAKRSATTRRRDRTKRKRLDELGTVRFAAQTGAEDRAATLAILIKQKSKAFAAMGVSNIFERPGHRDFYHALAIDPAMNPIVHISRLDVGERPAATNLGLIFRGTYYHLLASYDGGDAAKYGPGAAHLHELLRFAIEYGCKTFDFTIGDEPYKRDWCDARIVLFDHLAPVTFRGALAAAWLWALGELKRLIKQTPTLWRMAGRVRSALARVRPASSSSEI